MVAYFKLMETMGVESCRFLMKKRDDGVER